MKHWVGQGRGDAFADNISQTLPVVLDRCLGGGVAAVVGSTVLIGKLF